MEENVSREPQDAYAVEQVQGELVTVRSPVLAASLLGGLPDGVIQEAKWWEPHVLEVMTGLPPGSPAGSRPRSGYEATRSLREREQAKAEELLSLGREGVSARTVKRKRLRYEAEGLLGLVDGRGDRAKPTEGRTDRRVLEALKKALREATDKSTKNGHTDAARRLDRT